MDTLEPSHRIPRLPTTTTIKFTALYYASDTLVKKKDTKSNRQSSTLKEISNNVIDKVVFLAPNEQDQESRIIC